MTTLVLQYKFHGKNQPWRDLVSTPEDERRQMRDHRIAYEQVMGKTATLRIVRRTETILTNI